MSAGAALFGSLVVFVFSWAVLMTGLIMLGDWLRGEAQPGSQAEDRGDWRAIRLGAWLALAVAALFLLSVWWRHR